VLDGLGRVLDRPDDPPPAEATIPIDAPPPPPLERPPISRVLALGTRVIDGLLTCAEGQRIGIFGAAGAGKSRLIARIVRHAEADVFVIALVGERGREVGEFLDQALGPEARRRAVTVAATSDRPALERVKAAQVATAIAEWFRDRGRRVVLLIDSLTRLARAWREIGLAAGEPPTRRGFPPSVFAALPRLLERAASTRSGTISAFYTVLVEGELASDPIAEEVKSILDGHLILSSKLAEAGHYPAIDVLASGSRVMDQVVSREHSDAAIHLRRLLARHDEIELLVRIGEYQAGSDPVADEALRKIDAIRAFLRETADEATAFPVMLRRLREIAA
jgi:type III secretion protein N (ATPase)